MKVKLIIKTIILAVIIFIYNSITQFVSPIIANYLAMNQMQNSFDSNLGIQLYTYFTNYSWVFFIILIIFMFYKDVIHIINKVKEKIKNEEE